MNCVEFASQIATDLKALADAEALDDQTSDTFIAIAQIVLMQCEEIKDSLAHHPKALAPITFLKGQLNAISRLEQSAALRIYNRREEEGWQEAYDACTAKFNELMTIDQYPYPGDENKEVPTTMRSPMGANDPAAYDS